MFSIHFEFIFVYGVRKQSNFTFSPCSCLVFPAPFIEEAVFAPLYILASFVKHKLFVGVWVNLWAFYLVPLVYISVFLPVPYCLDTYSFVVSLKSGRLIPLALFFFLKIALAIQVFCVSIWIVTFCSRSVKNSIGNLIQIALNLPIIFGSIVIFIMLILLT